MEQAPTTAAVLQCIPGTSVQLGIQKHKQHQHKGSSTTAARADLLPSALCVYCIPTVYNISLRVYSLAHQECLHEPAHQLTESHCCQSVCDVCRA